ncbi:hypothetical protein C8R45DRAFT_1094859 [Mycena sanguinolenta]|nr:hypothetical protein C8R45DRAFT_1094859 [Mycena sanguinolenta]
MSNELGLGEPELPPEIEHMIFQIAALARLRRIPALMLVARHVKGRTLLYRVVFLKAPILLRDRLSLPSFAEDAVEKISPECLLHVTHLLISDDFVREHIQSWLLACTGVTNLCALFRCTPDKHPSFNNFINIRRLVIDPRALCGATLPPALFLNVTHLELSYHGDDGVRVDRVFQNISLVPLLRTSHYIRFTTNFCCAADSGGDTLGWQYSADAVTVVLVPVIVVVVVAEGGTEVFVNKSLRMRWRAANLKPPRVKSRTNGS